MTPIQDARVWRALLHAERHLHDAEADLGLDALAAVAHLSPYHFHRLFLAELGEPVARHVRRLRLERAASLLKHSDWELPRVAAACGYATQQSFTRAFTRAFGVSPARFQARAGRVRWGDRGSPRPRVEVTTLGPVHLAYVRARGPMHTLGEPMRAVLALARAGGWVGEGAMMVLRTYDEDGITAVGDQRTDVGWTTPEPRPAGDLHLSATLPGGAFAVRDLAGTYARVMEEGLRFLYEDLPASGLVPRAFEARVLLDPRQAALLAELEDPELPRRLRVAVPVEG